MCPKCKKARKLTRHHWLPQRWFGNTDNIILLCRKCHNAIEKAIEAREKGWKLTVGEYWEITENFMNTPMANTAPDYRRDKLRAGRITVGFRRRC